MALPNPTKSNYSNVDDITPTEMNDIGGNLNALVNGSAIIGVGGGTANAQTVTFSPVFTALTNGLKIGYKPTVTNTGAMTVVLDDLTAKSVLKREAGALVTVGAGDVVADVQIDLTFVTENDAWILDTQVNVVFLNAENVVTGSIELSSTTKAFILPRMTTTQRDAISPSSGGMLIFNTTTNRIEFLDSNNVWGPV